MKNEKSIIEIKEKDFLKNYFIQRNLETCNPVFIQFCFPQFEEEIAEIRIVR